MKLIVAGSTGFLGTEIIRQAVSNRAISSVLALARRETPAPPNVKPEDAKKLQSVIVKDFENYSEDVKQTLAGADACIWSIAITPSKMSSMDWEQVCKISRDYAIKGVEVMAQLPRDAGKAFRFTYVSGTAASRDKKPWIYGEYSMMRGEAEIRILDYAGKSDGKVEACVAKPGLITAPGKHNMLVSTLLAGMCMVISLPKVDVSEIAATLVHESINGFEKETLLNEDLVRIGQKLLASTP